jgi:hypothetical protein
MLHTILWRVVEMNEMPEIPFNCSWGIFVQYLAWSCSQQKKFKQSSMHNLPESTETVTMLGWF